MRLPKPSKKQVLGTTVPLLLVLVVSVVIIKLMQGPSEGVVTQAVLSDKVSTKEHGEPPASLDGKYFSLTYDRSFSTVADISDQDKLALEQYKLMRSQNFSNTLVTVSIRTQPAGGISEFPSYHMRKLQPKLYKESTEKAGTGQVVLMQKTDALEIVGFYVEPGHLATVAVTSSGADHGFAKEATELIKTFTWRK